MAKSFLAGLLALAFALLLVPPAQAHTVALQDSSAVFQILSGINAARIAHGLTPYALNPLLTQAAQAHSEYQRDTGQVTHDGPGGTRTINRVQAVGYPAVRANENIYAGMGGPGEAVNWWLGSTAGHVQNILHQSMREIGVGAASSSDGLTYYTVDFSAQPNVLPMFVNNDAYSTNNPAVTLALTNEEIFGGSASNIGRATQIMVSNTPDFANAVSLPWAQYVNWTLDSGAGDGLKTVYVRYIDAAGRTADSQDSIVLDTSGGGVTIAPTAMPTAPPPPTAVPPQPTAPVEEPTALPDAAFTPNSTSTMVTVTTTLIPTPTSHSRGVTTAPQPTPTEISKANTLLGLPVGLVRAVLFGVMGVGLVCIALGGVDLLRARRSRTESYEDEDDATD
jgi:hypothetical protein